MDKSKISTGGSIVAAVVASLCCIGPIAIAALGLGGVGLFIALGEYRPYIMAATLVLLGLAFFFTYRKREVECEDGTCKIESASKWSKVAVWFTAIVVGFFLIFPYLDLSSSAIRTQASGLQTAVLRVEGMTCSSCAKAVEIALKKNEGVGEANVSFERSEAVVQYDPSKAKPEDLEKRVDELGYSAKVVGRNLK